MVVKERLVLWDVDHTLVDGGGLGRRMYDRAFQAVAGRPLEHMVDMTGRTDQAIMSALLAWHGVPMPSGGLSDYFAALANAAFELRDELQSVGAALPGAAKALTQVAAAGSIQTVVTGNIRAVATVKLEVFGLDGLLDLDVGGYGDDGDTRPPLIHAAVERAGQKYARAFAPPDVVVIGDTPLDVAGALDVGAMAVAVASGRSSVAELQAAGPAAVLTDLTDPAQLLELVTAG
jgi:phosphoglycolate phosphatase-like HAD superfamily hydrolase